MRSRLIDLAFAAVLFGGAVWFWFVADGFPTSPRFAQIDTDFWPKIVFATLALVAGVHLARLGLELARTMGRERPRDPAPPDSSGGDGEGGPARVFGLAPGAVRAGAMAAAIFAYYLGFQTVGFAVATVLFLWVASFLLVYRNLVAKLVFAPVFTLLLTVFFSQVLSLPLPRGVGPFHDLNLLLY